MTRQDLRERTRALALRVIRLVKSLPNDVIGREIGRQVLRSGTSVGANYRAACRARSKREFIAKLGICLEEADETVYWMELLVESQAVPEQRMSDLIDECNQVVAILVTAINTGKANG